MRQVVWRVPLLAAIWVAVLAGPAAADPARPGDVRSEVTAITPATEGITAEVVGGDSFLRVRAERGRQVVVIGWDTLGVTSRLDVALVSGGTVDEVIARAGQARADGAPLVFASLAYDGGFGLPVDRLAGAVDGVHARVSDPAVDLPRLIAETGPRPPVGPTLRETLGLPRPANLFASAGQETKA